MSETEPPAKRASDAPDDAAADGAAAPGRARLSPRRLLPLALIVAGTVAFFAFGGHRYIGFDVLERHRETILAWTADNFVLAVAAFWIAYAVMVTLSIPGGAFLTMVGGFLFGTWEATVYVVTAATVGSTAVFLAARYAFFDYLHAKAGPAVRRMEHGFQENAMSYLLFLRLVPVFPFWLVNLVPAFLGVRLSTYVVGTVLGIVPGSFVYCSVGNGLGAILKEGRTPDLGIIFEPHVITPIVGLAVLSLLPVFYKKWKRRQAGA